MALAQKSESQIKHIFDGAYELLSVIGHGSSSIVYKARRLPKAPGDRPENGSIVALKVLTGQSRTSEVNLARMRREALAMLSCRHRNVTRLFDYVVAGDLCYICMEYAERSDLHSELENIARPLPPERVIRISQELFAGINSIHRAGIVHRDIKPENLLISCDGRTLIADFGIASLPTEKAQPEEFSRCVGTLDYLPPEALEGVETSAAFDLYSASVSMYQMLTRHLPFEAPTLAQQIERKISGRWTPLSEYLDQPLPQFEEFFSKALATEPSRRFKSVEEVQAHLELLLVIGSKKTVELRSVIPLAAANELLSASGKERLVLARVRRARADTVTLSATTSNKFLSAPIVPVAQRPVVETRKRRSIAFAGTLMILAGVVLGLRQFDAATAIASSVAGADRFFLRGDQNVISDLAQLIRRELLLGPEMRDRKEAVAFDTVAHSHSGLIMDLFADGQSVPLVTAPIDQDKLLIFLGIPGWTPQVVDFGALDRGEELKLRGAGLLMSLSINRNPGVPGNVISGHYLEASSRRKGSWVLYR